MFVSIDIFGSDITKQTIDFVLAGNDFFPVDCDCISRSQPTFNGRMSLATRAASAGRSRWRSGRMIGSLVESW